MAVVERDSQPIQCAWAPKSSSLSKPNTDSYNPSSCTETIEPGNNWKWNRYNEESLILPLLMCAREHLSTWLKWSLGLDSEDSTICLFVDQVYFTVETYGRPFSKDSGFFKLRSEEASSRVTSKEICSWRSHRHALHFETATYRKRHPHPLVFFSDSSQKIWPETRQADQKNNMLVSFKKSIPFQILESIQPLDNL